MIRTFLITSLEVLTIKRVSCSHRHWTMKLRHMWVKLFLLLTEQLEVMLLHLLNVPHCAPIKQITWGYPTTVLISKKRKKKRFSKKLSQ